MCLRTPLEGSLRLILLGPCLRGSYPVGLRWDQEFVFQQVPRRDWAAGLENCSKVQGHLKGEREEWCSLLTSQWVRLISLAYQQFNTQKSPHFYIFLLLCLKIQMVSFEYQVHCTSLMFLFWEKLGLFAFRLLVPLGPQDPIRGSSLVTWTLQDWGYLCPTRA